MNKMMLLTLINNLVKNEELIILINKIKYNELFVNNHNNFQINLLYEKFFQQNLKFDQIFIC